MAGTLGDIVSDCDRNGRYSDTIYNRRFKMQVAVSAEIILLDWAVIDVYRHPYPG